MAEQSAERGSGPVRRGEAARQFKTGNAAVNGYVLAHCVSETREQRLLREATLAMPECPMLAGTDQVRFMQWLVALTGARRIIEVGVFTGYTTLSLAAAAGEGARVVALDVSREFTDVGRPFWRDAGVDGRIELRIGPAADSMRAMVAAGEAGTHDFCFIDADKTGYDTYYELALQLLRPGGVIAVDNVLWSGRVVDEADQSADTVALRALNDKIAADKRVDISMLPISDGVTLARKL